MRFVKQCAATAMAAGTAVSATLVLLAVTAGPVSAHAAKTVGPYDVEVGWANEPTYVGQPNGVFLSVKQGDKPVNDIGKDLHVVVSANGKKSDQLALEPQFNADEGTGAGEFVAPLFPTAPGAYTFTFSGTINGSAFNDSFTASDATFDEVVDPASLQFPDKTPTAAALGANAGRVGARAEAAVTKAKSADDSASSAKTLAVVALIVGILLGGGGIVLGGMRGRRPSAR